MSDTNKVPWTFNINFEAHPDWKPLADWCWVHCPLTMLTRLGEVCNCKKHYDDSRGKETLCPVYKYAKKVDKSDTTNEISW